MADTKSIPLSKLLLDTSNPRLGDGTTSQPAALQAMMEAQGSKLIELADDITKHGWSPLDGFLVMPAEDGKGDYIVLEGNRRTTVLKLLANPKLGAEAFSKGQMSRLEQLAKVAEITNETNVPCAAVDSRDEGVHWLSLRHRGELEGAGLVRWGATEKERFDARTGKTSPAFAVLTLLVSKGLITEEEFDAVHITNLKRVLADGHVRGKLGIEIDSEQGAIKTHYPEREVLKGLSSLAKKLADDRFTVHNIYKRADRKKFVAEFAANELPNPKTKLAAPQVLGTGASAATATGGDTRVSGGRKATTRKTVAPTKPALKIAQKRIKDIYIELQLLRLEEHTNSGAVMLRVFLELTVDHYMQVHSVPKPKDEALRKKLRAVGAHLQQQGVMTRDELKPIRKVTDDGGFLATSIEALNAYVHNKEFAPSPRDLRTMWDNLEGFFVHIWK